VRGCCSRCRSSAEAFPVPLVGVAAAATSLASIFVVVAAVLDGWPVATLIGLATMLIVEGARRMSPVKVLYDPGSPSSTSPAPPSTDWSRNA
jgi:hypothetical protein